MLKIFLPWACLGFIAFIIFEKSERLVVRKSEEKKAIFTQHSEPQKQPHRLIQPLKSAVNNASFVTND